MKQSDMDRMATSKSFSLKRLQQNEDFAYNCIICFSNILEELLMQLSHSVFYTAFKLNLINSPAHKISAVLGDKLSNFDMLYKHFLLKLKLSSVLDANSAVLAGCLVDKVLKSIW